MCRYGVMSYKPHLACFECRKTFRRRLLTDVSENANAESSTAKCPQCGNILADMGLDFKSPPKDDLKAWKHVAELYISGITFHSCGCSGPGYIPRDKEALLKHLKKVHQQYIDTLRKWINFYEPETKKQRELMNQRRQIPYIPYELSRIRKKVSKAEIVAYWTEKIETIERQIERIK